MNNLTEINLSSAQRKVWPRTMERLKLYVDDWTIFPKDISDAEWATSVDYMQTLTAMCVAGQQIIIIWMTQSGYTDISVVDITNFHSDLLSRCKCKYCSKARAKGWR